MLEYLPQIFIEAAGEHLLLPLNQQVTYYSMLWFGGYNMPLAATVAIAGATLGTAFNFLMGRILMIMRNKEQIYLNDRIYGYGHRLLSTWLLPLLLFSWFYLGVLVVVLAGFFNVPWRRALPVITAGLIGHYCYTLFLL